MTESDWRTWKYSYDDSYYVYAGGKIYDIRDPISKWTITPHIELLQLSEVWVVNDQTPDPMDVYGRPVRFKGYDGLAPSSEWTLADPRDYLRFLGGEDRERLRHAIVESARR